MNRLLHGRKLVLLSLLVGLSKQLTSSNSFITWASHCEMVYSLRIRLCGVPYPPDLGLRGLTDSCFPLQGCTDPLGCSASVLTVQMHWVMSFPLCQTPSLGTYRFLEALRWAQLASEKGKEGKAEVPAKAGWVLEDGNRNKTQYSAN